MTTDLTIECASAPPIEIVSDAVAILHDSFAPDEGGGVTPETFMSVAPGRQLITASHDGVMLGFARIDQYEVATGLLAWLAVADGARSMGVGRQLIDASAQALADAGADSMFVECRIDDFYAPRRRFYERNGITSASGGDYWLESHDGSLIQYDLLHRSLAGNSNADQISNGARLVHASGAGRRPERLAAGLDWTLGNSTSITAERSQTTTPQGGGGTVQWRGEFDDTEVNELHAEAFDTRVFTNDESPWNHLAAHHSWGWVVARADDSTLIGFINVLSDGHTHAWVQDVMVAATAQRQGLGVRMINEVRDRAAAAGMEWLHVDFDDEHTAFYIDACGFTPANAGLMEL